MCEKSQWPFQNGTSFLRRNRVRERLKIRRKNRAIKKIRQ
jgi:hypothetical protein